MSKAQDARRLRDELLREGWEQKEGGTHYKMRHPHYGVLVFAKTPSDFRWEKNVRSNLKRLKQNAPLIQQLLKEENMRYPQWTDDDKLALIELSEKEGATRDSIVSEGAVRVNRTEGAVRLQLDKMIEEGHISLDFYKKTYQSFEQLAEPQLPETVHEETPTDSEATLRSALAAFNAALAAHVASRKNNFRVTVDKDAQGLPCVRIREIREVVW